MRGRAEGRAGANVVGIAEGLKNRSAVNLDHVQTVEQRRLEHYLGTVSPATMERVCGALLVAVGCDRGPDETPRWG